MIFSSSELNDHNEQIYTLIGPVSTSSAKRGSMNLCWRRKPEDGSHILYILLHAWTEPKKHLAGFLLLLTFKTPKALFFTLKYLTKYTPKMIFEEYIN
jgi:hypothetical protein